MPTSSFMVTYCNSGWGSDIVWCVYFRRPNVLFVVFSSQFYSDRVSTLAFAVLVGQSWLV